MTTTSPQVGPGLRMPTARTWADIAVLLVLAALGVLGFAPSFDGGAFLLAGFGGVLVGAATGIAAAMFRLGPLTTTAAALVAYFVFGTAFAVPSQALLGVFPSLQSLASLAVGSVFGWADLVTLTTPVGAPQYIAVVPYAASWLVALIATTLATRWLSSRPRTPWRFAVVLAAPIALYLAGILLGTDEAYQAGVRGVVFAVLALIWLGWRRPVDAIAHEGSTRLRNRKLAGTAIILTGAVLVGGGAGFWLAPPQDQRFVLRDEIEPPWDPLQFPSPLAGFRHFTKQVVDENLFTVTGLQPGDRVRMATLDSFTGKLWNVSDSDTSGSSGSGSFALVGRTLPDQDFVTGEPRDDVTFTIGAYDDVWLPGLGYPTDLEFTAGAAAENTDELRYNASTGSAVLTTGLSAGDTYTMDTVVQRVVPVDELTETPVAMVDMPPIEATPDIVTVRAQEFSEGLDTPAGQLEGIRLQLSENGFFSRGRANDTVPSRAGHGADRVTELFSRSQMIGDEEQYASAFALMARGLGYPARVVMGFAPEIDEGQASVDVTGDDVTAWVEVAFDDTGWVAFDPTPDETDVPQDQVPKPQSEPQPQVRQPPRLDNDDEDLLSPVELEEEEEEDQERPFVLPGWVYAVGSSILALAALFFLPLLVVGALKARRMRRRRTRGAGHDRVAAAWDELTDRYSELGYDVPGRITRLAVARRLEEQLGAEVRIRPLALETDAAVFSGHEIGADRSDIVWTEALAAVEVARSGLGRWRRLVSRFRLRRARDWAARMSAKKRD